jgi:hypothetical protein
MKKITLILGLFAFASCEKLDILPLSEPIFKIEKGEQGYVSIEGIKETKSNHEYTVDWGDGSKPETLNSFSFSHVYDKDGSYNIEVKQKSNLGRVGYSTKDVSIDNTYGDFKAYLGRETGDARVHFFIDQKGLGYTNRVNTYADGLDCNDTALIKAAGVVTTLKPGTYTFYALGSSKGTILKEVKVMIKNRGCVVQRV